MKREGEREKTDREKTGGGDKETEKTERGGRRQRQRERGEGSRETQDK